MNQQPFRAGPDGACCYHLYQIADTSPQEIIAASQNIQCDCCREDELLLPNPSVISSLAPLLINVWLYALKALCTSTLKLTLLLLQRVRGNRGQEKRGQREVNCHPSEIPVRQPSASHLGLNPLRYWVSPLTISLSFLPLGAE